MLKLCRSLLVVACLVLLGCSSDPLDIDVSDISVDLRLERVDKQLLEGAKGDMQAACETVQNKYPDYFTLYVEQMIRVGQVDDPSLPANLGYFLNDPVVTDTWPHIEAQFGDCSSLQAEFTEAFKHFKYYYPDVSVPDVVTLHTGFNYGVYPTDDVIGVGLEMYLGPENEIVKSLPGTDFPQYVKDQMRPDYLVVDAMNVWLFNRFYKAELFGSTLLSQMIYHGRMQYMLDACMPELEDSVKLKFGSYEFEWCEASEYSIWQFVVDKNVLYTADEMEIASWLNDGPFTKNLPRESPSRVGIWLGWRIVHNYMEKHPEVTLQQLMAETDVQKILRDYQPDKP